MQTIAILITQSTGSGLCRHASHFIDALLASEHRLSGVFFYGDGIFHGLKTLPTEGEDQSLLPFWRRLHQQGIPLYACISAAERRGLAAGEALLDPAFTVSGLGDLALLLARSDKVVQF